VKNAADTQHRVRQSALVIGTARGTPGAYEYGALDALALPSGGMESFPVIIAQSQREGPVLWLTASIHGDEYTGVQVIHRLLTPELLASLRGAIVALPTLNPAGLRVGERTAYYQRRHDPNRLFPLPQRRETAGSPPEGLPPLEASYRRLFEHIQATADFLIDLHNYSIGSIPFALRDPVYYMDAGGHAAAEHLWNLTDGMLKAFGHTVVNEFASGEYLKKGLHRSVSGAALNSASIPAFTAELGGYLTVDPVLVEAAVVGIRNVMRWAGMLDTEPEPILGVPVYTPGYPIRRMQHPHAPAAGIVQFLTRAGESIRAGQPVARITDIWGRPAAPDNGLIRTAYDGLVLGLAQGAAFYQSDPLLSLAVRDTEQRIMRYPG
jgi:predicted deacylase